MKTLRLVAYLEQARTAVVRAQKVNKDRYGQEHAVVKALQTDLNELNALIGELNSGTVDLENLLKKTK